MFTFYPLGRLLVTTNSDHYFHIDFICPSFQSFHNYKIVKYLLIEIWPTRPNAHRWSLVLLIVSVHPSVRSYVRTIDLKTQNKLMTDHTIGPGGSLNSLDLCLHVYIGIIVTWITNDCCIVGAHFQLTCWSGFYHPKPLGTDLRNEYGWWCRIAWNWNGITNCKGSTDASAIVLDLVKLAKTIWSFSFVNFAIFISHSCNCVSQF